MESKTIDYNKFFKDVEIIGSAADDVNKFRELHKKTLTKEVKKIGFGASYSPALLNTKYTADAYKTSNFAAIQKIVQSAYDDTRPIRSNIASNGLNAFQRVKKDGKEFYLSYSDKAVMWCMTENIKERVSKSGEITYSAVVQLGEYTSSGKLAGISYYNLSFKTVLTESVIALLVTRLISYVIARGAGFALGMILFNMGLFASEIGLGTVGFYVVTFAVKALVCALLFALVFIGIMYLWNWLNKKYTFKLEIFNWDKEHDWKIDDAYLLNAKLPNDEHRGEKDIRINLPKMKKKNETVTPPGFDPIELCDHVCHYCIIIFENDATFLEGLSYALRIKKDNTNEGFMFALDGPRFSENKQAAKDGLMPAKAYLESAIWNKSPRNFKIETTKENIPVQCTIDALKGRDDDTYHTIINICPD